MNAHYIWQSIAIASPDILRMQAKSGYMVRGASGAQTAWLSKLKQGIG